MVAYRDICDGTKRFEILDFVNSISEFTDFVNTLRAIGGGDEPEDIAGALQQANALSWSQHTRIAFLIADNPCHGTEFHGFDDDHPSGTPGIDIEDELQKLLSNSGQGTMTIYFGKVSDNTDSMIQRFSAVGMPLEVVIFSDLSKFTSTVTEGVRKSIFKTFTATGGGGKRSVAFFPVLDREYVYSGARSSDRTLKDYRILPNVPSSDDWKRLPSVAVKVYRNIRIKSISNLQKPLSIGVLKLAPHATTDGREEFTMQMQRADDPFAEGEVRIAYHGQLARKSTELNLDRNHMIMKSFKHNGKDINNRMQYFKQMEVSNIASFLAQEYNNSSFRPHHCARIRVLEVGVAEEEDDIKEKRGDRRYCFEEPLPEGYPFVKFCNNTGYWNNEHIDESLLRFVHFTYKVKNKYIMVVDLQGVHKDDYFILTDPVLLCEDILRFGSTNLGKVFIEKCINSTVVILQERGWHVYG